MTKTKKYEVHWNVTIDGEPATLKMKGLYESSAATDDEVMLEVDADTDLIGEDFIGYPTDSEDHEIVWEGFPIVYEVDEDTLDVVTDLTVRIQVDDVSDGKRTEFRASLYEVGSLDLLADGWGDSVAAASASALTNFLDQGPEVTA